MSNCWNCSESDGADTENPLTTDANAATDANTAANVATLETAEAVAEKLGVAGFRLEFSPATARLVVLAIRQIATGQPLTGAMLPRLAGDHEAPDEIIATLMRMVEPDAEGRIIGVLGLSQGDHPHDFSVGGRTLHTCCAWDALFLAPVLGQPADVRSRDPETGSLIELRVLPDGVEGPEDVVVSIVFPEIDLDGAWDAGRAQELFCSFVHFFEDRDSAQRWFAERQIPAAFLSLDEAFRLGQLRFGALIDAARADADETTVATG